MGEIVPFYLQTLPFLLAVFYINMFGHRHIQLVCLVGFVYQTWQ